MNSEMNDVNDYIFFYRCRGMERRGMAWLWTASQFSNGASFVVISLATAISVWRYGLLVHR